MPLTLKSMPPVTQIIAYRKIIIRNVTHSEGHASNQRQTQTDRSSRCTPNAQEYNRSSKYPGGKKVKKIVIPPKPQTCMGEAANTREKKKLKKQ